MQRLHPLRDLRRLSLPGARQVGRRVIAVRPALEHAERHPAAQRQGACGWRPTPRAGRSPRWSSSRRAAGALHRRHRGGVGRRGQLREAAAAQANDPHPNGLANGSDQVGRNYMFHNSRRVAGACPRRRTTPVPEDPGLNDFYFGDDDFEYPMGNIQMVGKSSAADVPRREAAGDRAGARRSRSMTSPSTPSILAVHRGPARARQPGHRSTPDGNISSDYTPNNLEPLDELYHRVKKHPRPPGHAPAPPHPAHRLHEERHPDRRRRPPGRHLPVRHRPGKARCWTRTARPTNWTTCTSSTPASSPASAR